MSGDNERISCVKVGNLKMTPKGTRDLSQALSKVCKHPSTHTDIHTQGLALSNQPNSKLLTPWATMAATLEAWALAVAEEAADTAAATPSAREDTGSLPSTQILPQEPNIWGHKRSLQTWLQ